jgi:GR25 family glycosyltransferase involved in LPS biosynthesis
VNAFVITLEGHAYSELKSARCVASAAANGLLQVERFKAVDRWHARDATKVRGLKWTWANENTSHSRCPHTGLKQHPYGSLEAKIGCAMSHFLLWETCVALKEPIVILEHDAVFLRQFPEFEFRGICQLNDPDGATPRGKWWSDQMVNRGPGVFQKTRVFPDDVPDGLAGNSAYVVKPFAAQELIDTVRDLGVWPNDATMCRQLFPYLEELFPFVTRVEQSMSTTS